MGLDRKLPALLESKPDIAIIQECAEPQVVQRKNSAFTPASSLWHGFSPHKGLGVASFGDYRVELDASFDEGNEIILPVRVHGPVRFNLLAVWSYNDRGKRGRRKMTGPVLRALQSSGGFCRENHPLIVAGDFNNNVIWDHRHGANKMSDIFDALEEFGLVSLYHGTRNAIRGEEEPTLYWRDRKAHGPTYHIDYIFAPKCWIQAGATLHMGDFTPHSDHIALTLELPE